MAGACAAAVWVAASLCLTVARASADPTGTARTELATVQRQVTAGAARIRSLTVAYDQASLTAAALGQQVASDQEQLSQVEQRLDAGRRLVQEAAILGYTGQAVPGAGASMSGPSDPAVRAVYIQLASGDLSETLDQYRAEQRTVGSAETALARQQEQARSAGERLQSARSEALAQATAEQAQLDQLQVQVNQLAAAAAAAAAARQAASATQGLPVNNGLVRLVQTIVAPSTTTSTTQPPSTDPPTTDPPTTDPPGEGAGGVWLELRECESGDNYQADTGNGYYGAYQFSEATWLDLGYSGFPYQAPPAEQDAAAMRLQSESGWSQWPACAAALGL